MKRLKEGGREGLLRDEVRMRKAAELIAESAKPVAAEPESAGEEIWTPEQGEAAGAEGAGDAGGGKEPGKLWTPGP